MSTGWWSATRRKRAARWPQGGSTDRSAHSARSRGTFSEALAESGSRRKQSCYGREQTFVLVDRAPITTALLAEHPPALQFRNGMLDGGAGLAQVMIEFCLPVLHFGAAEAGVTQRCSRVVSGASSQPRLAAPPQSASWHRNPRRTIRQSRRFPRRNRAGWATSSSPGGAGAGRVKHALAGRKHRVGALGEVDGVNLYHRQARGAHGSPDVMRGNGHAHLPASAHKAIPGGPDPAALGWLTRPATNTNTNAFTLHTATLQLCLEIVDRQGRPVLTARRSDRTRAWGARAPTGR